MHRNNTNNFLPALLQLTVCKTVSIMKWWMLASSDCSISELLLWMTHQIQLQSPHPSHIASGRWIPTPEYGWTTTSCLFLLPDQESSTVFIQHAFLCMAKFCEASTITGSYDTISMMWKISVWKNLSSIRELPMLHYLKKSVSANSYKRHHMNNIRHRKMKCFQKLLTFSFREIIPIVPQSPIPIVHHMAQFTLKHVHTHIMTHLHCYIYKIV